MKTLEEKSGKRVKKLTELMQKNGTKEKKMGKEMRSEM